MLGWMGYLEDGGGLDTVDLLGGGLGLGEELLSLEGSDTAGACMIWISWIDLKLQGKNR